MNGSDYEAFFTSGDGWLNQVQAIQAIRDSLNPSVILDADEVGVILGDDNDPKWTSTAPGFPAVYWNAAAAMYAYLFGTTSVVGLDVLGESQLIGYPSIPFNRGPPINGPWTAPPQFPSVSLLSWGGAFGSQGDGTARYWALKLLLDTFRPGPPAGTWAPGEADVLVNTSVVMGPPPAPAPTGAFTGEVLNLDTLTLACSDPGATIASLPFVAYGTPKGTCPSSTGWTRGSCDAPNATEIVSKLCLGKASCTVPFTTEIFGDPCYNTVKMGVVVAQCTTGGGSAPCGGGQQGPPVYAQAYLEAGGGKKVLIVNKKSTPQSVTVKGAGGGVGTWTFIDESTAYSPAQTIAVTQDTWTLQPFSLGILRM